VYRDNTEWTYVLSDLAKRNIHTVLVEGGAILLQNIIDSGLYDEVHVEVSQYSLSQSVGRLAQGVEAPKYVFSTQPTIVDGNRIYVEYKNGF
jgi:diaminohydroxyphosphoribosylaminopyrimidine deaminase/5-amino-6-(5-phosphoribosylamino)uracil reductase